MADFSHKACLRYWHDYKDPIIYQVIVRMETMEYWTLDGDPELEEAMGRLGETMDDVGRVDLQSEDRLIQLLVLLKMSRSLRIMQCMDMAYPGAASKLLNYAETHMNKNQSAFHLFLRRNMVFERLRLLTRIFSNKRLNLIQKVLEGEAE